MEKFEDKILTELINTLRNTQTRIANINDDRFTPLTEAIDLIDDSIDKLQDCVGETSNKESVLPISGVIESVCPKAKHEIMSINNITYCPDCGTKL